jgi:nicotinate-nucleotide adenylyltransferase
VTSTLRTGIFGGAFNPPHLGHLICAQEAHARLGLDLVLFVPVGEAPHREVEQDPGPQARAHLCDRAVGPDPRFEVSRVEVDRAGPSYTVDTLALLGESLPGHELVLILGADQASALASWHEPERVLSLARIAVASREGMEREAVVRRLHALPGHERVEFFDMPRIDVSSSLIRSRVAEGLPIRYLVPEGVAEEIESRGLFTSSSAVQTGAR